MKAPLRNTVVAIGFVLCLFVLFFLYLFSPKYYQNSFLTATIFIVFSIVSLYFFKKEKNYSLRGQYFKVSNFFILGFIIVHFQFYLDLILGYSTVDSIYVINRSVLNRSAIISAIALCSFVIGYFISANIYRNKNHVNGTQDINLSIIKFTLLLLLIAFVFFTPKSYFNSGYIKVNLPYAAILTNKFFLLVSASYLILNTRKLILAGKYTSGFFDYVRTVGLIPNTMFLIYCLLILVSGDRGPIIYIVLAYFGCYFFVSHKKYSIFTTVIAVLLAATLISLFAHIRHLDSTISPIDAIQKAIDSNASASKRESILSATEELSRSVRTVHAAVDYVELNGHTMGYNQILPLSAIIPGLGRVVFALTGIDPETHSMYILTNHIGAKWGMGTSLVADVWLDFGMPGIILFFTVFGWFLRWLDCNSYNRSPLNLLTYALIAGFLTGSIYMGRGTFLIAIRDSLQIYITILFFLVLSNALLKKRL